MILSSLFGLALATSSQTMAEEIELKEIVVSAGLTPIEEDKVARSYTVITAEDIEDQQEKTIADVLRQVPGLHVARSGGVGGLTEIRMRGSDPNQIMIIIDGAEVPHSALGFEFENLTADQIERVEILRGPQSALFGAGATAGVISISTKGGIDSGVKITTTLEGGMTNDVDNPSSAASVLLQGGSEQGNIAAGVSYRKEEGWDSSYAEDGDADGFESMSFNAKGELTSIDGINIKAAIRYTERTTEFDDTFFGCGSSSCYVVDADNKTEGNDFYAYIAADIELANGRANFIPELSYSTYQNEIHTPNGWTAFNESEVSNLKFTPKLAVTLDENEMHKLVFAAEAKREKFRHSYAGNDEKERDSSGVAVDYHGQITDELFVQAGIRYDNNDEFEDAIAWTASSSYQFDMGTTIKASIGQGQTNPTFFEQFGFIAGQFNGNPNLTPEKNFSWDVGVSQRILNDTIAVSATYFNETLIDAITGSGTSVDNLDGETKKQGVEFSANLSPIENFTIDLFYTYLHTEDPNGNNLRRRPEHSATLNAAYKFYDDRAKIGGSLNYFGENYQLNFGDSSSAKPTVKVDSYTTVDLNASFEVTDNFEVYGSVKNLFDTEYEEVLGYRAQPLTAYFGIKSSW